MDNDEIIRLLKERIEERGYNGKTGFLSNMHNIKIFKKKAYFMLSLYKGENGKFNDKDIKQIFEDRKDKYGTFLNLREESNGRLIEKCHELTKTMHKFCVDEIRKSNELKSGFQNRLNIPENLFYLPQFLVLDCYLFG